MVSGQNYSHYKFRADFTFVSHVFLNSVMNSGVHFLLPPLCGICDTIINMPGLCISCFQDMRPISDPICIRCGKPLTLSVPDNICGACMIKPPPLRAVRCAYYYNDTSRSLLLPFKHAGQIQIAATIAPLLRQDFSRLVTDAHIIIPIPLYWRRLLHRRYNQSAEIARRLCNFTAHNKAIKPQFAPHYLRRYKPTDMLRGKSALQRQQEVKGVFQVPKSAVPYLQNKPILLIDDVMTTGATLYEAARTLTRSGASSVDALCFARVL